MFDENEHPRDDGGKFTDKGGSRENYKQSVNDRIKWAKENGVDLPLNTDGSVDDLKLQELYEESNNTELSSLLGNEFTGYKGQDAINKLMEEKQGHIKGAFHRDDIGDIALLWGNDKLGLKHIILQREAQGINIEDFLKNIGQVIEEGNYRKKNDRGNIEFIHNGKIAVVAPEYKGNKITYLLTAFKTQ